MKAQFTIQNHSSLLEPTSLRPITGDRIFIGDTVCGEWYDTGNEVMAPRIVAALNSHEELLAVLSEAQETIDMLAEDAEEAGYDAKAHNACNLAMRCREAIAKAKGQP